MNREEKRNVSEPIDLDLWDVPKRRRRSAKAARLLNKAAAAKAQAEYAAAHYGPASSEPAWQSIQSKYAQQEGEALLKPSGEVIQYDQANEAVHFDPENTEFDLDRAILLETLKNPDMLSIDASEQRMESALKARVLAPALDAVKAADAKDSLSKMLVQHMTAAHFSAMKCIERSNNDRLPPMELARLLNTAGRLMESYSRGLIALLRLKTGGKQTVLVQHINVTAREAVVAQHIKAGGKRNHVQEQPIEERQ
ncbi:MAG TPA: hypothetical protein VH640_10085 [Bryobacteraceae bacterium]|jgi:hypothetical protein